MMTAFVEPASPEAVSHAVRQALEQRGALVMEHRHSRVRFLAPAATGWSWARQGYVGLYQPLGEEHVELRLIVRAQWPWRLLWGVALLDVLVALTAVATNPSGSTWVLLALLTGAALLLAGLVYIATLRPVRAEERATMAAFREALARELPDATFLTREERDERRLEEDIEAEVTRRRLRKARADAPPAAKAAPAPGKRFSLRPGARKAEAPPPAADELEARRQALLARKAELEREREEPRR